MPYSDPHSAAARAAAAERRRRWRERHADDPQRLAQQNAARRARRARQRQADPSYQATERQRLDGRLADGTLTGAGARTFVAVDGESTSEGTHRYVMLCASTGHVLVERDGLATLDVLLWLIARKRERKRATFVAFGLNYDVNMWLRDLPRHVLRRLWVRHEARWYVRELGVYVRLAWIPSKRFWVSVTGVGSVEVSEVFGFFQQSFLAALTSWEVPDVAGALARIKRGKADRSGFRWRDRARVQRYCLAECQLLVDLMGQLRVSLEAAGLVPRKWQGAGSVAAALLARESTVAEHHRPDEKLPYQVAPLPRHAYFGGRFEVFQQGELDAADQYDVRSAYPAQAVNLPSLVGSWKRHRDYQPELPWTLWRVTWTTPHHHGPVMPFPYRYKRSIHYPERGHGWYWDAEVRAARALWGDRIRVLEGWQLRPDDPTARPFAFVADLYQLRAAAKAEGRPEQKAYKLALNSLYGKLAQGVGWRGAVPRFRSYVWAGLITSGTRAQLLEMVTADPQAVIAMATDGVLYSRDPELATGPGLGELEHDRVADLFVAQSGVYVSTAGERRRGWMRTEIDWAAVLEGWRTSGPWYTQQGTARRFIGLGGALGRTDPWAVWRTWADVPRVLALMPTRKTPANLVSNRRHEPWKRGELLRWLPPEGWPRRLSDIYVPKSDGTERDLAGAEFVENSEQPSLGALFGEH
jgi:hypothetical protein